MVKNSLEAQEQEHRHRRKKSKIKPVIYSVLAFVLSFVLFLLSICMVIKFTVFSKDYMFHIMDTTGYYNMVKYELQSRLTDLGNASGFQPSFAQDFASQYDIQKAVDNYIESFYAGDSTLVETISFKQQLYAAVQDYIRENHIEVSDETNDNITYFINEAASIYVNQIAIPFFSMIGKYIYNARTIFNIILGSLTGAALLISAILFFSNRYHHRRYKYLCYGLLGGMLATLVLPTFMFIWNKIPKVNIATRSLYNLFVGYFQQLFSSFYICTGVLAVLSLLTFILYVRYYSKYISK